MPEPSVPETMGSQPCTFGSEAEPFSPSWRDNRPGLDPSARRNRPGENRVRSPAVMFRQKVHRPETGRHSPAHKGLRTPPLSDRNRFSSLPWSRQLSSLARHRDQRCGHSGRGLRKHDAVINFYHLVRHGLHDHPVDVRDLVVAGVDRVHRADAGRYVAVNVEAELVRFLDTGFEATRD